MKIESNIYKIIYLILALVIIIVVIKFYSSSQTNIPEINKNTSSGIFQNAIFNIKSPKNISFSNEETPLFNSSVKESLDRELTINSFRHSSTILVLKRGNKYFPIIEPILKKNNVPDDFKYIAVIESELLMHARSPRRASSFWQFRKAAGKEFGLEINSEVDERYHIEKATEAACKYFLKAYKKYNNWTLAAASYNMGRSAVNKQLRIQKTNTYYNLYLNSETARYIYRILAMKLIFENPKQYGFNLKQKDLYPYIPTYQIKIDSTISDFADFAKAHKINYKTLKEFNPWLRRYSLTNKSRKTYFIKIPEKKHVQLIPERNLIDSVNHK